MLIRRENEPFKNLWCFPGGKIESTEDYLSATKREIQEETGLIIKFPEIHLLKIVYVEKYLIFCSISQLDDDFIIKNKNQQKDFTYAGINCKWFNLEEISKLQENDLVPGMKELIPKAFNLLKLNYVKI